MTVYIWNKNQVLVSMDWSLFLNEDWIIETKTEKEENLAKSYNLVKLEDLAKKYLPLLFPEDKGEKNKDPETPETPEIPEDKETKGKWKWK